MFDLKETPKRIVVISVIAAVILFFTSLAVANAVNIRSTKSFNSTTDDNNAENTGNANSNNIMLNFRDENYVQESIVISKSTITDIYLEYHVEGSKFIIFKKADDNENAHSGVIIDETVYDFGEVSTLFQAEKCVISTANIYGDALIKITGAFGAIYSPSEYYCIDSTENGKFPRLVLHIENYNNKEIDLDSNGVKEVFECSMSASLLHRYDVKSQKFYVADLIADTGAMQVIMDDNDLFTAYIERGELYGVYKYSNGQLAETLYQAR